MTDTHLNRRPTAVHGPTVELEFRIRDDRYFLIAESEAADCELVLNEVLPQSTGNLLEYVTVYGAPADLVLADAMNWPDIADTRVVTSDGETSLLELVVTGPSLARTAADSKAIPRRISARRGVGTLVLEVPPQGDVQRVVTMTQRRHPHSRLVARRRHESAPLFAENVFRERVMGDLTDKQRETLGVAYSMGYFEQPRRASSVECAEALGISQSTFSQHLHVALRKILSQILDD